MNKRTRTRFFYLLVFVFLVFGSGVVFYAEGWRVQFYPLSLDKVGGIYVRTYPADAAVLVNGKPSGFSVRFFDQGHLFSNLFPGNYSVAVTKPGYLPWTDVLPVRPAFVTSLPQLVLVPAAGEAVTSTPVSGMTVFGNNLAIQTANGINFTGTPVPGTKILAGTDDGQRILTFSAGSGIYWWTDLQTGTTTPAGALAPRLILGFNEVFSTVPGNGLLLLGHSSSSLRLANMGTGRVTALADGVQISAVGTAPTRIGWTVWNAKTNNSSLSFYDLLASALFANTDAVPGKTVQMSFLNPDSLLVLQDSGILYNVSLVNGARQELDRGVRDFYPSPDGSYIAALDQDGISVLPPDGGGNYFFFAIPDRQSIKRVIWYRDDSHLFLVYPDRTAFLSLEDAYLHNLDTVTGTGAVEYMSGTNSLYAIAGGNLLRFDFPG